MIRKNILPSFLTLLSFISWWSCKNTDQSTKIDDLAAYYFPLDSLREGVVYEYQSLNDSFPPEYWYYRSFMEQDTQYLTVVNYDHYFMPQLLTTNEVLKNGMLLKDMFLYETDTLTDKQIQIPVEIASGSVYPFAVTDTNSIFLYKISWADIKDQNHITTLIKNRRFKTKATYTLDTETVSCAVFEVKELVADYRDGYLEHEFSGEEWYAEGIGLVYYKKQISDDFVLAYQLSNRYSMQYLETLFKSYQEQ